MNHRKWDKDTVKLMLFADVEAEHNALYADWKKSSLEAERLAKVNGDLCDKIAELERPIRVPFSDEAIEKMARVAHNAYSDYWIAQEIPILDYPRDQLFMRWEEEGEHMQASRIAMIRAALAAGGIEPCAVPEYAPPNAAFPISSTIERNMQLEKECEQLTDRLARVSAKSARRAKALKEYQRGMARLRKPHDELYRVAYDRFSKTLDDNARLRAELSERRAEQAPMGEEIVRLRQQLYNMNAIRKLLTQGDDIRTEEIRGVEDVPLYVPERASDEELAYLAWRAENDKGIAEGRDWEGCEYDDEARGFAEAGAAAIRDAVLAGVGARASHEPTDAEIEALARVLHKAQDGFYCRYGDHATKFEDSAPLLLAVARAAFAHIGRVPVGFELDVTEDEVNKWIDQMDDGDFCLDHFLDLCRSRLKPVYECKECAETRKHYNDLGAIMQQVADLSRTAMDGE